MAKFSTVLPPGEYNKNNLACDFVKLQQAKVKKTILHFDNTKCAIFDLQVSYKKLDFKFKNIQG